MISQQDTVPILYLKSFAIAFVIYISLECIGRLFSHSFWVVSMLLIMWPIMWLSQRVGVLEQTLWENSLAMFFVRGVCFSLFISILSLPRIHWYFNKRQHRAVISSIFWTLLIICISSIIIGIVILFETPDLNFTGQD
jgi:hypothetical protein